MSNIEIEVIKKNYKEIEHQVNGVRQNIADVQRSLHRIENCLMSDEDMGVVGLVERVNDMNKKVIEIDSIVKDIQTQALIAKAKKTLLKTIFGFVYVAVAYIIEKILIHFHWIT